MVSIIIPTYQEAENLPQLITAIENSLAGIEHELIVVDDNSPDGTGKLAKELAQKHRNLKVLHRQDKKGVASAIVDGIKIATGQIIGTLNADRQHPAELLPVMLEQIKTHDVVIASRYLKKGHSDESFWRRFVSRGAITMAHLLLPSVRGISDPMSGFFLFRRSATEGTTVLSRPVSATLQIRLSLDECYRTRAIKQTGSIFPRDVSPSSDCRNAWTGEAPVLQGCEKTEILAQLDAG